MSNLPRVAKEQGRKFYEEVVKPAMNKNLYPHEVQSAIFSQLLAYETLLKPEYRLRIDRWINGTIFTYVVKADSGNPPGCQCWELVTRPITTTKQIDEMLTDFWADVPAEYKI